MLCSSYQTEWYHKVFYFTVIGKFVRLFTSFCFSFQQDVNVITMLKAVSTIQLLDLVFALTVVITLLVSFVINAKTNFTEI